jgi:hypothetical protein
MSRHPKQQQRKNTRKPHTDRGSCLEKGIRASESTNIKNEAADKDKDGSFERFLVSVLAYVS